MLNEKDQELLALFRENALEASSKLAFEHRMQENIVFREKVELINAMHSYLLHQDDIAILKEYAEEEKKTQSNQTHVFSLSYKRILAVASIVILVVLGTLQINIFSSLGDEDLVVHQTPSIEQGEEISLSLRNAIENFRKKNYADAQPIFDVLSSEYLLEKPDLQLAKGVIYLELEQYEKAQKEFMLLIKSHQLYQNQGNLYLALTAYRSEDYPAALHYIKLIEPHSSFYLSGQKIKQKIK